MEYITEKQQIYIKEHLEENISLLASLGKIPAPSHQEDARADFVKKWLEAAGAAHVYIDSAKNVIYPVNITDETEDIVVIMAHMDIVFPDTQPLPLYISDGKMFAPGIGDDTANLVQLLMCVKYMIQNNMKAKCGVLFVANACEEGLGNLEGTKAVMEAFKGRIREFISFDGYTGGVTARAVGSQRYKVTVKTEGGHSYGKFGNKNVIYYLSSMIKDLYTKEVPKTEKTTYNVGTIQGGTTVNSIAQEATMLYEFRSVDRDCLKEMEEFFYSVIEMYRHMGIAVEVEVKGIRPCNGDVNAASLEAFTKANLDMISYFTGETWMPGDGSTDANIPLSMGILANTFGTIRGGGAHTREEWVNLDSVEEGFCIAMAAVNRYFEEKL